MHPTDYPIESFYSTFRNPNLENLRSTNIEGGGVFLLISQATSYQGESTIAYNNPAKPWMHCFTASVTNGYQIQKVIDLFIAPLSPALCDFS